MRTRKTFLVVTDLGLIAYWALSAAGIISVGTDDFIVAWNWSFLPLDALAIAAGLAWSFLAAHHRLSTPMFATALALTHAAGLVAISFFALWGTWDASWWIVNLWLTLMPIGLALASLRPGPDVAVAAFDDAAGAVVGGIEHPCTCSAPN